MEASTESPLSSGIVPDDEVNHSIPAADTLATRLRAARKRHAWTQQELANRACTTQAVIQKIENGKSLRPRIIGSIAEALDVEPSWLLFGVSEAAPLSATAIAVARAWSELPESQRNSVRDLVTRLSKQD